MGFDNKLNLKREKSYLSVFFRLTSEGKMNAGVFGEGMTGNGPTFAQCKDKEEMNAETRSCVRSEEELR